MPTCNILASPLDFIAIHMLHQQLNSRIQLYQKTSIKSVYSQAIRLQSNNFNQTPAATYVQCSSLLIGEWGGGGRLCTAYNFAPAIGWRMGWWWASAYHVPCVCAVRCFRFIHMFTDHTSSKMEFNCYLLLDNLICNVCTSLIPN